MPIPNQESVGLDYHPIYDLSGGMVTNYSYTKVKSNQYLRLLNGDIMEDGAASKRRGRLKLNSAPIPGNPTVHSLMSIGRISGPDLILSGANGRFDEITTPGVINNIKLGLSPNAKIQSAMLDNYLFCVNGVDTPWLTQGAAATTYRIGITAPLNMVGFTADRAAGGDGTVGGTGLHRLTFRWRSSITGARSNPFLSGTAIQSINLTNPLIGGQQTYRVTIAAGAVSADPQVDNIDVFVQEENAVADAPYFYLGSMPNAIGAASFGTNVSDTALIVKERIDVDDLPAPNSLRDLETWRGRMVGILDDYHVAFSKKRVDGNSFVNLPTSWPATNSLEVGFGDGDPLVKIIRFQDYIFAFKRRSIWLLLGDFDTSDFEFKQLKTNHTNVGCLNLRSVVIAGDRIYFVSDDLKFNYFGITDFSSTELRLASPAPSDLVNDLFRLFTSGNRENINLVNYTFAQYTQIWVSFSDGSSGIDGANNFNVFVFDYTANQGQGGWHIHSGLEIASSVIARDTFRDYYIYSGDYYGFVWQHNIGDGDGALINSTSTGGNYTQLTLGVVVGGPFVVGEVVNGGTSGANGTITVVGGGFIRVNATTDAFVIGETITGQTSGATAPVTAAVSMFFDTTQNFTLELVGVFQSIVNGTGVDQLRRIAVVVSPTQLQLATQYSRVPDNTSQYTLGGIDFQFWSRNDWCNQERPVDFDKYAWYLDVDAEFNGPNFTKSLGAYLKIQFCKDRSVVPFYEEVRQILADTAFWAFAFWGIDRWSPNALSEIQYGLDFYFKQISHRIINNLSGQYVKINGWTYCFQTLDRLRLT